ncbi:hypothetical protein KR032_011101 [Drosophila birchii]|nr:hypothetical protein KR032_011101 [Drosophila birchii]
MDKYFFSLFHSPFFSRHKGNLTQKPIHYLNQKNPSKLFYRAYATISAIGAEEEPSSNQWNMLMPVREYNKHIAKIPNCKMRQRPALRGAFAWMCSLPFVLLLLLVLLLDVAQALDPAASGAGSSGTGGGGGAASTAGGNGGASGGSLSSGPPTLIANLTEQGSPGVYNSTMGYNANYMYI